MTNRTYFRQEKHDLTLKLLDLTLVPTSMIRLVKAYDDCGKFRTGPSRRSVYASATIFELCRLGIYASAIKEGLEPLF